MKVMDHGAIVRLENGSIGLVHVSEIADRYVHSARDHLAERDTVSVRVLRQDERGRYELSVKRCGAPPRAEPERVAVQQARPQQVALEQPATFEDRLRCFLKDSEERLGDLKRNLEAKRGRR